MPHLYIHIEIDAILTYMSRLRTGFKKGYRVVATSPAKELREHLRSLALSGDLFAL